MTDTIIAILTDAADDSLHTGVLEVCADVSWAGIAVEPDDVGNESGNMRSGLVISVNNTAINNEDG